MELFRCEPFEQKNKHYWSVILLISNVVDPDISGGIVHVGTHRCGSGVFSSGRGKLFVLERREQMRQTLVEAHVPFPYLRDLDTLWRVGSEPGEMRTNGGPVISRSSHAAPF